MKTPIEAAPLDRGSSVGGAVDYREFLRKKLITTQPSGFAADRDLILPGLYDYQKDLVSWGLKRGRAALFTMTGTGKTAMQSAWADAVHQYDSRPVLILAPLAVSKQTTREMGEKFNLDIRQCRTGKDLGPGLNITNYEMLHHFSPDGLAGIVLDESSILKAFDGKTRKMITDFSRNIPFRLPCSATPSPNDYMELGTHAEFLGVMSYTEMLATFFVHDGGETSKWRLKGHAEEAFWKWLASWGAFLTRPSDLGYSDEGFELPPLHTHQHIVESGPTDGALFAFEAKGLMERRNARRESMTRRVERAAEIVAKSDKPFLVWCDLNAESEALTKTIPGAVEVTGSQSADYKEKMMLDFASGNIEVMVTKPDIAGFGMNWQVCGDTAFVGLSDSFEAIFQATKRFHRYPRKDPVNRHIIISEAEGSVLANVLRKESDFMAMIDTMVGHTKSIMQENIKGLVNEKIEYRAENKMIIPEWIKEEV